MNLRERFKITMRRKPYTNAETPKMTLLHSAAKCGSLESAQVLIITGTDVNAIDEAGRTPLHYGAERGHLDIVNALISAGANVNIKDRSERTPLHLCNHNNIDVVKALLSAGAEVNVNKEENDWTPLHFTVAVGDLGIIKEIIGAGANLNARDKRGRTSLHYCCYKGNTSVDVVKELIACGADVNLKDIEGRNPLHYSAQLSLAVITKTLLASNADDKALDDTGRTPLELTDQYFETETCKLLVKHTMLFNPSPRKPTFEYNAELLDEIWDLYEQQVKKLKETFLGNSRVSFFKLLLERDENKLALYASEDNFGINSESGKAWYYQEFPLYAEDIEAKYIKGVNRANLLFESQMLMESHVFKMFPIEIIINVSEYLENKDLENILSLFKVNKTADTAMEEQ